MGLRFRKSINLGHGFKINFNKKSIGVSGGVKGARFSVNSDGRTTRSVGIPGTGIYDVKTSHIGNKDIQKNTAPEENTEYVRQTKTITDYIPGFRSRSKNHIIIATAYYILSLLGAICLKSDFLFALILLWSVPFCTFAVIDTIKSKNLSKLLPLPICFWLLLLSSACIHTPISPTEIHLNNQEITFEDINQEQSVTYSVVPDNADTSKIELVSNNSEVAYFSGDILHSKTEGETTVYAMQKGSSVKSEEIHVVVKDKKAEAERAAQEAARLKAEEEARQAEERAKQEEAVQAAAAKRNASKSAQTSKATEDSSNSETVYIGKTGNKYHRKSCQTLKGGGRAISLSEAQKNRTPCRICKP